MERGRIVDEDIIGLLEPPVLILSTNNGRGNRSIGDALLERLDGRVRVSHRQIEEYLPPGIVNEDSARYRTIVERFDFLLHLVYRVPIFYYRKYLKERLLGFSDLTGLRKCIEDSKAKTVVCISHRPAFWASSAKRRYGMDFKLFCLQTEYGDNLGYRYLFWDVVDGYMSPIAKEDMSIRFPAGMRYFLIDLPVGREYRRISQKPGGRNDVLVVCGYWGLGPVQKIVRLIVEGLPDVRVKVVCGENESLHQSLKAAYGVDPRVEVHGRVESIYPILAECASVITKPGAATILEARTAGRKIFLLKGIPVSEENNARYAISHFDAEWFSIQGFKRWLEGGIRMDIGA